MNFCQSFLFITFTPTHSASNSHFLFFSIGLVAFLFLGGGGCSVIFPSPATFHLSALGARLRHLLDCILPTSGDMATGYCQFLAEPLLRERTLQPP